MSKHFRHNDKQVVLSLCKQVYKAPSDSKSETLEAHRQRASFNSKLQTLRQSSRIIEKQTIGLACMLTIFVCVWFCVFTYWISLIDFRRNSLLWRLSALSAFLLEIDCFVLKSQRDFGFGRILTVRTVCRTSHESRSANLTTNRTHS